MTLAFELHGDGCVFAHPSQYDRAADELDLLLERRDAGALSKMRYRRALEELVSRHPWFVDGHAHLGNALYGEGRFEQALDAYGRGFSLCMEVLPSGFEAVIEWGHLENRPFLRAAHGMTLCQLKLGRTEEGLSMLERMLAWNPGDHQGVRFIIGSEYLRAGLDGNARSFFETEASQYPPYRYELALLLLRKEHHVAAATSLRLGFVENGYIAEILCGNPDPLPAGIWHGHGDRMPQAAKDHVCEYGGLWRETPGAIAFLRWLHTHPRVMAERAAILGYDEETLWERDAARRVFLFRTRSAAACRIDDALSEEIVVERLDRHGRTVWPWLHAAAACGA